MIMVPFTHLVLLHREIGIHRGRTWGFRDVFGFRTLRDVPFVTLASKVKDAYEGRNLPPHDGWPAQHEALRWLVERGHDGIYALDDQGLKLISSSDVLEARKIKRDRRTVDSDSPLGPSQIAITPAEGLTPADSIPAVLPALDEGLKLADSVLEALDEQQLAGSPARFHISDGHHRALALYILGANEVRARILSKEEALTRVLSKDAERTRTQS